MDEERIRWIGSIGLWQASRRAGKVRYDFVQRDPDGKLHIYYGVTEEGIEGEWRHFLQEGGEPEAPEVMQAVLTAAAKEPPVAVIAAPIAAPAPPEVVPTPLPTATEMQASPSGTASGEQPSRRRRGGGRRRKVMPSEVLTAEPLSAEPDATILSPAESKPVEAAESASQQEETGKDSRRARRSRKTSDLPPEAGQPASPSQEAEVTSSTEVTETRPRRKSSRQRASGQNVESEPPEQAAE